MDNLRPTETAQRMRTVLEKQRRAFSAEGFADLQTRLARLDRLIKMLQVNEERIIQAEQTDFHGKSPTLIRLGEILGPVNAIRYTKENIAEWMKPQPIDLPPEHEQIGVRAEIQYQPLGVVGVISPWNGPVILSCLPLIGIFAAGNRAMIKMSEFTPAAAELFKDMISDFFEESEVAVFTGGPDVAAHFTQLPFDHLLYTGSSRVAKLVMKAAAENLVPVTLELGGKSPVIIGNGTDLPVAAKRISYGKIIHAGQVCVSPDYVFVPNRQMGAFIEGVSHAVHDMYPTFSSNEDYTPVLNADRYQRLQAMVRDAEDKGARVIIVGQDNEQQEQRRNLRFPLHLIIDPPEDSLVMNEEIFGPILPIKGYDRLEEALAYVKAHPKPLAAYYFGSDASEIQEFQRNICAGGMVINDVLCQIFYEQLPFGGVGPSGMGHYRGKEGFRTFSNQMTVLTQTDNDQVLEAMRPPYGDAIRAFVDQHIFLNE